MREACFSAAWVLSAACYGGNIPAGSPCSVEGVCPRGQVCIEEVCRGEDTQPPDAPQTIVVGEERDEVEDTGLWSDDPNANLGREGHFAIDSGERGLVRFRFGAVPSGMLVTSARLTLNTFDQVDSPTGTVLIFEMLEPWDEYESTWNDSSPGTAWMRGVGGGTFAEAEAVASITPRQLNTAYDADLPLALVQRWLDDPDRNLGLAIVRGTAVGHVHIATRDRSDGVRSWSTLTIRLEPRGD